MQTEKEILINNIILSMSSIIPSQELTILESVLNQKLNKVEIIQTETLPTTIDDTNSYIVSLFSAKKLGKLSNNTIKYYTKTVEKLLDYTNKNIINITTPDISNFLNSLTLTNAPTSINNYRRNLSAFFNWMRKSHFIIENPVEAIEQYRQDEKPIDHLIPEEVEQLKTGCKTSKERALIETLRSTATRVGELINLKYGDINWQNGHVSVYAQKTRTYRTVGLDGVAIKYLNEYLKTRTDITDETPLFTNRNGKPLSACSVRNMLNKIATTSKLKRKIYPHLFRKTTATNIIKRGGTVHDAGEYLGHKDQSTAGKHYSYVSDEHRFSIFERFVATV